MLRKVRKQVTQALSAVSPSENRHEVLTNEEDSFEGLLCPLCMRAFLSPRELQDHFNTHESQQQVVDDQVPTSSTSSVSPLDSSSNGYVNEEVFFNTEMEIRDLRQAIKDEKRYASELKKELDRLHAVIASQTNVPEGEVPYLVQQIQMLEAGKSMVTQRMLEMEKVLSAANRANENLKVQKTEILAKVEELTTKVVALTDEVEEKQAEKLVLRDELVRFKNENEKAASEIDQLARQLEQRPSEDDIRVLRQELVRSQQLMDNITQTRENEIAEHLSTIEALKRRKEELEGELLGKKTELNSILLKAQDDVAQKEEEKELLSQQHAEAGKRINELETLLKERSKNVEDSDTAKRANEQRIFEVESKLAELEDEKGNLEAELKKSIEDHGKTSGELQATVERMTKAETQGIEERLELEKQIEVLSGLLEEQKRKDEEKTIILQSTEEVVRKAIEDSTVQSDKLKNNEVIIAELSAKTTAMEEELRLEKEKLRTSMTAVKADKEAYDEAIRCLNDENKAKRIELEKKIENLDALLKKITEENRELQQDKESLQKFLDQQKSQNSDKDERISAIEAALEAAEEKIARTSAEMVNILGRTDEAIRERDLLKEKLANAENNANSLMEKIAEGEGGTKLAMEQMQQEKQKLSEELEKMEAQLRAIKDEKARILESKEKEWSSKLSSKKEKLKKLELSLKNLEHDYSTCEEENKMKSDRLLALEKEYFEEMEKKNADLSEKEAVLRSLKEGHERLSEALKTNETLLSEKEEIILKDHDRIQDAVQKISAAESKARLLEEELRKAMSSAEEAKIVVLEKGRLESELILLNETFEKERESFLGEKSGLETRVVSLNDEIKVLKQNALDEKETAECRLTELREKHQRSFDDAQKEISELKEAVEALNKVVEKGSEDFRVKETELKNTIASLTSNLDFLKQSYRELEEKMSTKDENLQKHSMESKSLQQRVEELELLLDTKAAEARSLEEAYKTERSRLKEEYAELQNNFGSILKRNDELAMEVKSVSELLRGSETLLLDKEATIQEKVLEVEKLIVEKNGMEKKSRNLEGELDALQKKVAKLEEEIVNTAGQNVELQGAIESLKKELLLKEASIKEVERQMAELGKAGDAAISDFKEQVLTLEELKKRLEIELSEALGVVSLKDKEMVELNGQLAALEKIKCLADANVTEMKEKVAILEEDLASKCRTIEQLETAKTEMEAQHTLETERFAKSSVDWSNAELLLKDEIASLRSKLEDTNSKLTSLSAVFSAKENSLNEDINVLRKELEVANASVLKLKADLASTEECAVYLKKDYEKQLNARNGQLDQCKAEYSDKEKLLNEELRDKVSKIDELTSSLNRSEACVIEGKATLDELRQELLEAKEHCRALEGSASGYAEEKKALLQRCLNTESDLDFERERAAENRRRFEEALAAMHELGRANQTLQMDISKQFSRKWLDDTEAVSCNACQKAFSLTVRKHHCRMCGLIFCANCSSRTAQIPSHKNPVRICNSCHEDLQNR